MELPAVQGTEREDKRLLLCSQYFVLKADRESWTVTRSTLLGFDRPSSRIDPEKNFFASLLSNHLSRPCLATTENKVAFGPNTSDSASIANDSSDGSLPVFRVNFDPKCMDLLIRYLRGYFIDFKTLSLEMRENLLRDADLIGIPGLKTEMEEQCKSSQIDWSFVPSNRFDAWDVVKELGNYKDLRLLESPDIKIAFFRSRVCETYLKTGPLRVYTACQLHTEGEYLGCQALSTILHKMDNNRESFDKWYDQYVQVENLDSSSCFPRDKNKKIVMKLYVRGMDNSDSDELNNLLKTMQQVETEAIELMVSLVREKWSRKEWKDMETDVLKRLLSACLVQRHRQDPKHLTKEDLMIPLKRADLKRLQFIDIADEQVSSREAWWTVVQQKPLFRLYMRPSHIWYRPGTRLWGVHWEVPVISLTADLKASSPKKKIKLA